MKPNCAKNNVTNSNAPDNYECQTNSDQGIIGEGRDDLLVVRGRAAARPYLQIAKQDSNLAALCRAAQALTSGAQPVIKVAAGGGHSLFLTNGGSLWAMGANGLG